MTIQTKYEIGDTVHFIHGERIVWDFVDSIDIKVAYSRTTIVYQIKHTAKDQSPIRKLESQLFSSKEELIKSLYD